MIRSMTGYGYAERDTPAGRLRLEVKTVNHRYINPNVRSPSGFDRYEKAIADALKMHLARGHVSAFLTLDRSSAEKPAGPAVDLERARGYLAAFEELREALSLSGEPDLRMLARFGDVFRAPDVERTEGVDDEDIRSLADAAGAACRAMREAEGLRLAADLRERLEAVEGHLDVVEARAPER